MISAQTLRVCREGEPASAFPDHALIGRSNHRQGVLDLGRRRKILPDQAAPFGKILRTAEVDSVVLQRLPLHHQPVALWRLDRAMQLKAVKALGAAERGARFGDGGLEILLGARLDVDLSNFSDHERTSSLGNGALLQTMQKPEKVRMTGNSNSPPASADT